MFESDRPCHATHLTQLSFVVRGWKRHISFTMIVLSLKEPGNCLLC